MVHAGGTAELGPQTPRWGSRGCSPPPWEDWSLLRFIQHSFIKIPICSILNAQRAKSEICLVDLLMSVSLPLSIQSSMYL